MKINPEFKDLIPPLAEDELSHLEASIINNGCRDPLVVWGGTLVDGHNRHEICTRHNVEFQTTEMSFTDDAEAKVWIIDNQFSRRNLSDWVKYELMQVKKEVLLAVGKENMESGAVATNTGMSTIDKPAHNTREAIASELNWSTGKVAMADKVMKEADTEVIEQIRSGDMSINQAYQELKPEKEKKPHVSNNSGENEWYTPSKFIEAAIQVMGGIDLDPASSELANKTVNAKTFYTKEDNGLEQVWSGKVWMNPPYAQPLISEFSSKLVDSLETISQAIVLVNNATETNWFQNMATRSNAICFPSKRIKFVDKEGNPSGEPLQGQAILYFGDRFKEFNDIFSQHGLVLAHEVY